MKKFYTFLMLLVMTASLTLNATVVRDGETSPVTYTKNIDLGYRPSGAWMDPATIKFSTTGEEYTVLSIKSLHPFFIVYDLSRPVDVTADQPFTAEVTHGESDVEGKISGQIVVEHTLGKDTINVTAKAYFPEAKDVWETAEEITLPFTETAKLEAYKNYNFLEGEQPDVPLGDIVYKAVFEEDAIIFANAENARLTIYKEGFDGYGGPRENNFYKAEIAPDENAETLFSFDFNDGKPNGWNIFEEDGDKDQWVLTDPNNTYISGTDESIAIYSNTYSSGALYPDNYIHTAEKYAITKKSVLSWDARSADLSNMYNKEHYGVVVSTDKNNWEVVWEATINYTGFNHVMVSLEKYAGQEVYVGFRHFDCNGNEATGLIIDNILLANTSINGVGIQNAILPAGTYYFLIEGELSTEYTVDIRLASDVEDDDAIEEINTTFIIYPNPVNDRLYIETQTLTQTVEVYDIFGSLQQQSAVSGQQSAIDVSDLNSGIYFVKVMTENGEIVKKFVKE